MTMPKGYANLNPCYNCGHPDSQHTKQLKIIKGTFPKGIKQPESNIRVCHAACNQCDCTDYVDKETIRWQQQKYQQELFGQHYQQHFAHHNKQPQQQPPPLQQRRILRSDGSWFYYSSNTYVMPAEDPGVQDQDQQQGDGYNTDYHDNTANTVDDVGGDYEF